MFYGIPISIDGDDKKRLARWAFKTALMADRTAKPRFHTAPDSHFRYLFHHQEPPPSAAILFSRYIPEPGEDPFAAWKGTSWVTLRDSGGRKHDGYRISFTVGQLLCQVYGHVDPDDGGFMIGWEEYVNGSFIPDSFRQLWPLRNGHYEWPPTGGHFSNAGLKLLQPEPEDE
jgi:hypothetical protein